MFVQSDITKRVIQVYDRLKEDGMVNGKQDFSDKIGYHFVSFNKVYSGERNFPKTKLQDIVNVFNARMEFLTNGEVPIFKLVSKTVKMKVKDVQISFAKDSVIVKYKELNDTNKSIEFIIE